MKPTPDVVGPCGSAWKPDMNALAQGRVHAGVASWLVSAPWAHPAWSMYAVDCIHLRPLPGMRPAKIMLAGATHELFVAAIDPDWPFSLVKVPRTLRPINFAAQFMAENDEAAAMAIEKAVRSITQGELNPDTDGRKQWIDLFGTSNFKEGALAREDTVKKVGDKIVVEGMGASNIKKIIGPDSKN